MTGEQHQQHEQVSQHSQQTDEPYGHSQKAETHYVLARVELIGSRVTDNLLSLLANNVVVTTFELMAGVFLGVLQRLPKTHVIIRLPTEEGVVMQTAVEVLVVVGVSEESIAHVNSRFHAAV